MIVLVTGATGTVGREVVRALLERNVQVRALSRDPRTADLPAEVEVIKGDLTDPASLEPALDDVEAVHLITFDAARGAGGGDALSDPEAIFERLRAHGVRRATALQNGYPGPIEDALVAGEFPGAVLQPVEFMANALGWAGAVQSGVVREPYVERLSAMVHEGDIGDVAAVALTEDGHAGAELVITGPEILTLQDKIDAIAAATGSAVQLVGLSVEEAETEWRAQGFDDEAIGFFHAVFGDTPEVGRTVADTVPRLTGRPGRTFAQWARDHRNAFARPASGS